MEAVLIGKILVMVGMGGVTGDQIGKDNFVGGISLAVATVGFWLVFFL
ncbi:MAG TPA: hypothetical protein VJC06_02015 [Candidatus Paceibacterota bacterium]